MNDEYLWKKTGDSGDIARLEDLLSDFRYVPAAAPVIRKSRSRWIWGLIPAAAAAAVLVAAGIWTSGVRIPETARVEMPVIVPAAEQMPVVIPRDDPQPIRPVETHSADARRVKAVYRQRAALPSTAKKRSSAPLPDTFTAEEKQAYRQVLLALYITGSQLKTVSDTINGIEDARSLNNHK